MTFIEAWQAEEKAANTFIAPKITRGHEFSVRDYFRQHHPDLSQLINYDLGPGHEAPCSGASIASPARSDWSQDGCDPERSG